MLFITIILLLICSIITKSGISEKDFSTKYSIKQISTLILNRNFEILGLSGTQSYFLQNETNFLLNPFLTDKTLNGFPLNSKFCTFIPRIIIDHNLIILCNSSQIITFTEEGIYLSSFYQDSTEGTIHFFNEYQHNKFLMINTTLNRFDINIVDIDLLGTQRIVPKYIYKDTLGELNYPRCFYYEMYDQFACTYQGAKDVITRLNIILFSSALVKKTNVQVFSTSVAYYAALEIDDKLLIISVGSSELMRRVVIITTGINVGSGIETKITFEVYSINLVKLSKEMVMLLIETMTDIIISQYDSSLKEMGQPIRYYIGIRQSFIFSAVFNPYSAVYIQAIPMNYGNQLTIYYTLPFCNNITHYLELNEKEMWNVVNENQRIVFTGKIPTNPPELSPIDLNNPYTIPLQLQFATTGEFKYYYHIIEKTLSKINSTFGEVDIYSLRCHITFKICNLGELLNFNRTRCKSEEELKDEMDNVMDRIEEDILDLQKNLSSGNSTYQIFNTTEEGKNESYENGKNLSQVILNDCERKLKEHNNIPLDQPLLIFKKDSKGDDRLTNQVDYAVFMLNGTKLDLSICDQEEPITIITPIINITSDEITNIGDLVDKGINPYDPQDMFFTDICYTYQKNGIDIPRNDRVKEELRDTSLICPNNCTYSGLNKKNNTANCTCIPMKSSNGFSNIKDILLQSLTQGNWEMLTCYQLVFDTKILKNSIGSYIILTMNLLIIIAIGIFFCHKLKKLTDYCCVLQRKTKKREDAMKTQLPNQSGCPLFVNDKERDINNNMNMNDGNDEENNHPKKTQDFKRKDIVNNINIYYHPSPKDFYPKKTESVQHYNLEDYHRMDFKDLVTKDQRTFCILYWNYLQLIHPIINTFFMISKVHLRPVRVSLFFLNFIVTYAINALFYTDDNISNNYHNTGLEKFLFNLPVSLYTSLVVFIVNLIFKLLSDPEPGIARITKITTVNEQSKKIRSFLLCFKFRLVIVFILETSFMAFFWYCTAAFCGVYQKSQLEWLKSGAISTAIGMVIPFVLGLVCACLTKISLKYEISFFYVICKILA